MAKSKIPWTEWTWEVTGGCTKCSAGCKNCYAIPMIGNRFANNPIHKGRYEGLVKDNNWTGKIELFRDRIEQPMGWGKKSRMVFVNPRSDLFHPGVNIGWLTHIFDTIEQCPQHTFQILTKRPERALKMMWGRHEDNDGWRYYGDGDYDKNIWFGVTVCNQKEADEKIPILLQIPAAVRFVSIEPMLGAIDIRKYLSLRQKCVDGLRKKGCGFTGASFEFEHPRKEGAYRCPKCKSNHDYLITPSVDWVIVGGESGPGARPMDPDWARGIRDQCVAADVPFFFKGWGKWLPGPEAKHLSDEELSKHKCQEKITLVPGGEHIIYTFKVGKKKAGRLLDGLKWVEYPKGGE